MPEAALGILIGIIISFIVVLILFLRSINVIRKKELEIIELNSQNSLLSQKHKTILLEKWELKLRASHPPMFYKKQIIEKSSQFSVIIVSDAMPVYGYNHQCRNPEYLKYQLKLPWLPGWEKDTWMYEVLDVETCDRELCSEEELISIQLKQQP